MKPTLTAFEQSPDCERRLARDMRVRWALEELGQACDVRMLTSWPPVWAKPTGSTGPSAPAT